METPDHMNLRPSKLDACNEVLSAFFDRYSPWTTCSERALDLLPTNIPGIRCGIIGLAFAFAMMSRLKGETDSVEEKTARALLAGSLVQNATLEFPTNRPGGTRLTLGSSFFHSDAGYWWTKAFLSAGSGDSTACAQEVKTFLSFSPNTECLDIVIGQSGWLLGTLSLAKYVPFAGPKSELLSRAIQIASHVYDCLRIGNVQDRKPLEDLNLAHGWAGAIYALLRCDEMCERESDPWVKQQVMALTKEVVINEYGGYVLPHIENETSIASSWCHGSTGQVYFWLSAFKQFREVDFLNLAKMAAFQSGQRANVHDPSLCCGLTGQAYALFAMYSATNDAIWSKRAEEILTLAALRVRSLTDEDPYAHALYNGWTGLALLCAYSISDVVPEMSFM